jgi:pimeloyl-ACP methyl ester carboxylesterase
MAVMDRVEFGDIAVEFEVTGSGDKVVVLHARPFVGWYAPLVDALSGYSLLWYRRAVPVDGRRFSIDDDAAVGAELLEHVGFGRPHVVGHSYGGLLAMALARSNAVELGSMALLEPAGSGLLDPETATAGLAPLMEAYRTRGPEVAMEQFLGVVLGEDARRLLDRFLPGGFGEAVANADQFFQLELPAAARWSFGQADADRIDLPILNVIGTETVPRFVQSAAMIQSLFPGAVRVELPGAGHLMMAEEPTLLAARLVEFWRSPLGTRSR